MDEHLAALLDGNDEHVEQVPDGTFEAVQDGQEPDVVSVCCSDSRVSQEGMWHVDEPGEHFTASNIGNQVWDADVGERIVNGSVLYPIHHCGTEAVAVVGHTGCGAVTAAYDVVRGEPAPRPLGVSKLVELLVPVVEAGLTDERVDAATDGTPADGVDEATVRDQLVEYNVHTQIDFLLDAPEIPDDVSVYGFVYDFHGTYGSELGRTRLVNVDGATDPASIRDSLSASYHDAVATLL
ncbi:carbonic anhydrase [Halovivax asiaticus JCM 14624]|uniref:carbonic anhydrase n=1 Tax=Halovivax asiaticus JCM 14624 TaxID=1227490 RepID=M0BGF3_9EURY|nr:carbonic anhydrase [Halovivax asiaticus]ELZ09383.1 carbonic anhydrase [Halovivax asiaticus JCM 14624]